MNVVFIRVPDIWSGFAHDRTSCKMLNGWDSIMRSAACPEPRAGLGRLIAPAFGPSPHVLGGGDEEAKVVSAFLRWLRMRMITPDSKSSAMPSASPFRLQLFCFDFRKTTALETTETYSERFFRRLPPLPVSYRIRPGRMDIRKY
jgi:hypothetical protein